MVLVKIVVYVESDYNDDYGCEYNKPILKKLMEKLNGLGFDVWEMECKGNELLEDCNLENDYDLIDKVKKLEE